MRTLTVASARFSPLMTPAPFDPLPESRLTFGSTAAALVLETESFAAFAASTSTFKRVARFFAGWLANAASRVGWASRCSSCSFSARLTVGEASESFNKWMGLAEADEERSRKTER